MPTIAFPRHHLASLQALAGRVVEKRSVDIDHGTLARDLLTGFHEVCMYAGLDSVLDEVGKAFDVSDVSDGASLADDHKLQGALSDRLGSKANFDPRGPRNAKAGQLTECLSTVLALEPFDEPDRTITLPNEVRVEVTAALASVVDVELGAQVRTSIIAKARENVQEQHSSTFEKIVAQLDERGMRMTKQPKVPLDASQEIQKLLYAARTAIVEGAARRALERATEVLQRADAAAAARLDEQVTPTATRRDVVLRRATDPRAPKTSAAVVHALFEGITELAQLAWAAVEQVVRPYSARETFLVGELVEHPKFGRGSVLSTAIQRIEVEFPEGKTFLVHARK